MSFEFQHMRDAGVFDRPEVQALVELAGSKLPDIDRKDLVP